MLNKPLRPTKTFKILKKFQKKKNRIVLAIMLIKVDLLSYLKVVIHNVAF